MSAAASGVAVSPSAREPGLVWRTARPLARVAVLRASRIGDFICTTPALRALRRAVPYAEITVITLPELRGVVERLPYVDRYEEFPGAPGLAEQLYDPG